MARPELNVIAVGGDGDTARDAARGAEGEAETETDVADADGEERDFLDRCRGLSREEAGTADMAEAKEKEKEVVDVVKEQLAAGAIRTRDDCDNLSHQFFFDEREKSFHEKHQRRNGVLFVQYNG